MLGRKIVRLQGNGQISLPAEVRRKLGLRKGDLVTFIETDEGVLIAAETAPERTTAKTLSEQGITLEELLSPRPSEEEIPFHEYSDEEIAKFIRDDRLTDEARAIVERFDRKRAG